jgi:ABC-2 type transport system permease protein
MIADIWTIVWKDWKELLFQRGGLRRGWANLLVMLGVFGVFLPLQAGSEWVTSPFVVATWAWVPLWLVASVIADSFAGERERHTLETLLASRMPDLPILLGKVLAAVGYGWGMAMASLLLGLLTVNAAHWQGHLLLYPLTTAAGGAAVSLLVAGLAAGAGVLVSLRAETVRQAQQTLGIATMAIVWVPILALNLAPKGWLKSVGQGAPSVSGGQVLLAALVVLAVVDLLLLGAARARFQRSRLILD